MAEVLGIAGSVIAVVQVSGTIISLCYQYRQASKDRDGDVKNILQEVRETRNVMERLLEMVQLDGEEYLPFLKAMCAKEGLLAQCQTLLDDLADKITPPIKKWQRLGSQLLWPLKQKETDKLLATLDRLKSTIHFGLSTDTSTSVVAIRQSTSRTDKTVENIQQQASETRKAKALSNLAKWLNAPSQSARHNHLSKQRASGTIEWLFEKPAYKSWVSCDQHTFWLHGAAGRGKSTIASAVIDNLNHDTALAYFYIDSTDRENSAADSLLQSIIMQLAYRTRKVPEVPYADLEAFELDINHDQDSILESVLEYNAPEQPPSFNDLMTMARASVTQFPSSCIVIDALNEAPDRHAMMETISKILSWKIPGLKIFLTSHYDPSISHALLESTTSQLQIEESTTKADLEVFIRFELHEHPRMSMWTAELKKHIETTLLDDAGGSFRWVVCQLDRLKNCLNARDAKMTLKTMPKSLTETYRLILDSIDETHKLYVMQLLWWLTVSRPLSVAEAAEVVALDMDEGGSISFDPDLRLCSPWDVASICPSLIACQQSTVVDANDVHGATLRLAHETVKGFMLDTQRSNITGRSLCSIADIHALVCQSSLAYLCIIRETLNEAMLEGFPLCRYAAEFWLSHYQQSGDQERPELVALAFSLMDDKAVCPLYQNWCKMYNPDKPWAPPDLQRRDFPSPLYYASLAGLEELVRQLLAAGYAADREYGARFRTPFAAASAGGHYRVVLALVQGTPSIDIPKDPEASGLLAASQGGHSSVVKLLLDSGVQPTSDWAFNEEDPLSAAASRGHLDIVQMLIDRGANPGIYEPKGQFPSAMLAAATKNHIDCVLAMLPNANRATIVPAMEILARTKRLDRPTLERFAEYESDTIITFAAALDDSTMASDLLERGASTETEHKDQLTAIGFFHRPSVKMSALYTACENGNMSLVRELLEKGANVDAEHDVRSDLYALNCSVRQGNIELVRLLLENGADVHARGEDGSAIEIAAYCGHDQIVRLLLAHHTHPPASTLREAVRGNHLSTIELLIASGLGVNQTAGFLSRETPLCTAVRHRRSSLVVWLLEHGADPNIDPVEYGQSPLCLAAKLDDVTLIERLLRAGADLSQQSGAQTVTAGVAALHTAVDNKSEDAVRALLDAQIDPNAIIQYRGSSCPLLTFASIEGNAVIVEALVKAGANLDTRYLPEQQDESPLDSACIRGNTEIVRALIRLGANVNEQNRYGQTVTHIAARAYDEGKMLEMLLADYGADPSLALHNGSQPIHSAASHNRPKSIEILLAHGVDINVTNHTGMTALHWAAESGSTNAAAFLLDHGADQSLQEQTTHFTARDYAELRVRESRKLMRFERKNLLQLFSNSSEAEQATQELSHQVL